ncbi:MAG: hypothetical protein VB093_00370 [Propionicimonas sp.]|nr:hypothetical protein [Propionicimonas sp.]
MDLVPFGESVVTVAPADAVTSRQLRDTLGRVGFELTGRSRRREHQPGALDHLRAFAEGDTDVGRS